MLFRLQEHYEDSIMEDRGVSDCLICFEHIPATIRLHEQTLYQCVCECDGHIHEHCLSQWICMTRRCPICRTLVRPIQCSAKYDNTPFTTHHMYRFVVLFFIPIYAILITCQVFAAVLRRK